MSHSSRSSEASISACCCCCWRETQSVRMAALCSNTAVLRLLLTLCAVYSSISVSSSSSSLLKLSMILKGQLSLFSRGVIVSVLSSATSVSVHATDNTAMQQIAPGRDGLYEVRKVMSVLPGIGAADIYYPKQYEGEWQVKQDITAIIDNSATVDGKKPPLAERYESVGAGKSLLYNRIYSRYDDKVILDRGVSTQSLFKQLYASTSLTTFDPSNPNVVNVALPDNVKINLLTTKRAAEDPKNDGAVDTDGAVGYSEFVRILDDNGNEEPSLYGYRLLARYKIDPSDPARILGQERLYIYTEKDADGGSKPLEVVKSKVTMSRVPLGSRGS